MRCRVFCLTLLLLLAGRLAHAQTNLIKDPGFESAPTKTDLPGEGWWLYEARGQPEASLDSTAARGGKAAARLQAKEDAKFVLVSPPFEVSSGDELRFEGWVRCEQSSSPGGRGYLGRRFATQRAACSSAPIF